MKTTFHILILSISIVSIILTVGIIFNFYLHHIQIAAIEEKKDNVNITTINNTPAATNASAANTVQLSVKKETPGVYRWINASNAEDNPTLKVFKNTNNIIKIQNPTDAKHELVIDIGDDILPSSVDVDPSSSGQLSFNPNMTGTFTYHCAYHPYTMKGTIEVVNK